ncbi:MAG: NfeD family protein [Clostridiales Family XIII bacterium]|jgi:membrane protein implicated in regulation of membrane protease activity|nr:NfeD family protein [Clostridiales Family XIII bacterium]
MGSLDVVFWENSLPIVWIVVAVILALIEAATLGLVTIWFAIGAVAALFAALADASFFVQVVVFLAVAALMLIFTRPVAVKRLRLGREKNVTEQMEGRTGIVTEAVPPFGTGLVKVGGVFWTAVGEEPARGIEKDVEIAVIRIEGVKLVVRPAAKEGGM